MLDTHATIKNGLLLINGKTMTDKKLAVLINVLAADLAITKAEKKPAAIK